ncbi:MAG: YSC84-related protein, partial [Gammaproteobacteria bacterium]|nr:YSC84-related protein [Gammaproteobacteria bacterium]
TNSEIDAKVDAALERLKAEVPGSAAIIADAKGILVFSEVIKAGFVFAGEGGEGALRIGGKTEGYYTIVSASVGFQAGGQKRDIIMVFLDAGALKNFQASNGWKVGADGTVTLIDTGASGIIDTVMLKKPIVGFIVGQKGLMAGVSLDGSKITRLKR